MASIRDALTDAFDAAESSGDLTEQPTPAPAPEPASDPAPAETTAKPPEGATTTPRDERGKFAPRDTLRVKPTPHEYRKAWEVKLRDGEKMPDFDLAKRPASWRPEMEQHYGTLPPQVRDYLHFRDWESARGIEPLKQQAQQLSQWRMALGPVLEQLQRNGTPPEIFLRDIAGTVMQLAGPGPMDQKRQVLNRIAAQYGVEMAQQVAAESNRQQAQQTAAAATEAGQPVPPEVKALLDDVRGLKADLEARQKAQDEAEWREAASSIAAIEQDTARFPHFAKVRVTMGKLIESGFANSPQDAYTKAVRLDPELLASEQAAQAAETQKKQAQEAAAAAAAARRNVVSPKGSSPGAAANSKSTPKDRRDAISNAWDDVIGTGARV